MDADPVEIRVLGCLIEKQRTTPDTYPLSLNALRLACNQATSRDPVVDYDEPTIRQALERLSFKRWVRLASGPGSRAAKYRHLLNDALELDDQELALLAVLMLRGPQTPGELKQRTERLHSSALYADARTNDCRLTIENVIAAAARGAVVLNYAAVTAIRPDGADVRVDGHDVAVRAAAIVNATGPWLDHLRRLEDPAAVPSIRLSKGVHVLSLIHI